jgi:pyruvate dehydrogenase E2 component (dihydrolipoamide acetyltransferase)
VVPVIRDCDKKGVITCKRTGRHRAKARDGKLSPGEMQAAFSISSSGNRRLNFPDHQCPKLRSWAHRDPHQTRLEGRPVRTATDAPPSLSYDHRVVDGAEGARFILPEWRQRHSAVIL